MRQKLDFLNRFELAVFARVNELVDLGMVRMLLFQMRFETGRLDGRVIAERTLVLPLSRVTHLVPPESVVITRFVVAVGTSVALVTRVTSDMQRQVGG